MAAGGMKSIIFGGYATTNAAGSTTYNSLSSGSGSQASDTTESLVQQVVSCAGDIDYLRIVLLTAPGTGNSRTFTVMKNTVATALTIAVSGTNTSAADTTHSFSVVAGDLLDIREVVSASVTATNNTQFACRFTATTNNTQPLIWGNKVTIGAATTNYSNIQGCQVTRTTQSNSLIPIPCAGTFSALYISSSAVALTLANTVTVVKNGTPTALSASIALGNTTGNDLSDTISVVAGDTISYTIANNSATATAYTCSMVFSPSVNGNGIATLGNTNVTQNNTVYSPVYGAQLSVTEINRAGSAIACTVKNAYGSVSGPIANGQTVTVSFRKNVGSSGPTITFTGDGTNTITGNDTTNTVTLADDDTIDWKITASATSGAGDVLQIGVIVFISPVPSVRNTGFFLMFY